VPARLQQQRLVQQSGALPLQRRLRSPVLRGPRTWRLGGQRSGVGSRRYVVDSRKWHLKVFVSARKEFVIALFVIFLGIIPGMVLLALLSYYMKHNLLYFRSAKPSAPTYVKDCLFSSFQHVLSACRGGSLFSSRSASGGSNTPNNIRNLEIKQTGLVSTTNADVIIRSNTITKSTNRESGGRRLSLKNIKGLKLNTSLRAKKDCGSSQNSETPATTETVCFESPMVVVSVRDLARRFDQTPQKM
jgi:hypothetical protein